MEIMCHSHVNVIDIPTMYLPYDFYETAVEFFYNSIEFLGISVSFPIDFYRNFMEISMEFQQMLYSIFYKNVLFLMNFPVNSYEFLWIIHGNIYGTPI